MKTINWPLLTISKNANSTIIVIYIKYPRRTKLPWRIYGLVPKASPLKKSVENLNAKFAFNLLTSIIRFRNFPVKLGWKLLNRSDPFRETNACRYNCITISNLDQWINKIIIIIIYNIQHLRTKVLRSK